MGKLLDFARNFLLASTVIATNIDIADAGGKKCTNEDSLQETAKCLEDKVRNLGTVLGLDGEEYGVIVQGNIPNIGIYTPNKNTIQIVDPRDKTVFTKTGSESTTRKIKDLPKEEQRRLMQAIIKTCIGLKGNMAKDGGPLKTEIEWYRAIFDKEYDKTVAKQNKVLDGGKKNELTDGDSDKLVSLFKEKTRLLSMSPVSVERGLSAIIGVLEGYCRSVAVPEVAAPK
ncbi:MAG: hypothetical protein OEY94_06955 [Alphaproteobacteria bacterium]|nr:hypothetical protein [Alphaproteobacteria bacterium]